MAVRVRRRAAVDGAAMVIIFGSFDPTEISSDLTSVTAQVVTFSGRTAVTLGG